MTASSDVFFEHSGVMCMCSCFPLIRLLGSTNFSSCVLISPLVVFMLPLNLLLLLLESLSVYPPHEHFHPVLVACWSGFVVGREVHFRHNLVYIPGLLSLAHPLPLLTMPARKALVVSLLPPNSIHRGPPESPWKKKIMLSIFYFEKAHLPDTRPSLP